jgi:hypothetical protein
MLCMLGSIKVLISRDDPRDYRGAGVKRTMVTEAPAFSNDRSPVEPCKRSLASLLLGAGRATTAPLPL